MSRRTIGLLLGLAVASGAAIYAIAGGGGSSAPTAKAGPAPASSTQAAPAMRKGPQLAAPSQNASQAEASSPDRSVQLPQVPPELAARAVKLAGDRATTPPPTGTGTVRTNPAMFDAGEVEAQRKQAMDVLAKEPTNVQALRVVVSAACVNKDMKSAKSYYASLPPGDQADMAASCRGFGIDLDPNKSWAKGEPKGVPQPTKQRPPR